MIEVHHYTHNSISAGFDFSLIIGHPEGQESEDHIWSCGLMSSGELGLGIVPSEGEEAAAVTTPTEVEDMPNIISVSGSSRYSLALDRNDHVWKSSTESQGFFARIPGLEQITSISAGYFHQLFLDQSGRVWGLGGTNQGLLDLLQHDR